MQRTTMLSAWHNMLPVWSVICMLVAMGPACGAVAPPPPPVSEKWIHYPESIRVATISQVKVPHAQKVIALTFDDGPNPPYTTQILRTLAKYHAKATFFLIGHELTEYPESGRAIVRAGHAVGGHSWDHPSKPRNPESQIARTDDTIRKILRIQPHLFRPPYGIMTNGLARVASNRNETVLLWSIDTFDWKRPGARHIADRVVRGAKPGSIVLMHDGGGNRSQTSRALQLILKSLTKSGYRFVTVPELIQLGKNGSNPGDSLHPKLPQPSSHPRLH